MNEDLVWSPRSVVGTSLAPIVAARIRKQVACGIEIGTGNGALDRIESLEPLLVVLVPEGHNLL